MKKYIFFLLISLSPGFWAQSQSKDVPYSYYPDEYAKLTQSDWSEMKKTLDSFLSFKSLDEVNNDPHPHSAKYTLARMADISWDRQMEKTVGSYLSIYLDQLLTGKSFLKISELSVSQFLSSGHPIFLPNQVIHALFIIDNETACRKIKEIWMDASGSNTKGYLENLSIYTFNLFQTLNDKNACAFFLKNYSFLQKNFAGQKVELNRTKLKCEVSGMDDQKKAWEYLWNNSELNSSSILNNDTQYKWYRNILLLNNIYGDLEMEPILKISENASSVNKKYIFLYSACFNVNQCISANKDYMIKESDIKYLDSAIEEMKIQIVGSKKSFGEDDFLLKTYNNMKSGLSGK